MSVLDKLMFWKKKDEFSDIGLDIGKDVGGSGMSLGKADTGFGAQGDLGLGSTPEPNFGAQPPRQPSTPSFQQPPQQFAQPSFQQQSHNDYSVSKDIEVISSKLDALRAGIESINQRLANIERIAYGEQEQQRRRSW